MTRKERSVWTVIVLGFVFAAGLGVGVAAGDAECPEVVECEVDCSIDCPCPACEICPDDTDITEDRLCICDEDGMDVVCLCDDPCPPPKVQKKIIPHGAVQPSYRLRFSGYVNPEDLEHAALTGTYNWKWRVKPSLMVTYDGRRPGSYVTEDPKIQMIRNLGWAIDPARATVDSPGWSALLGVSVEFWPR